MDVRGKGRTGRREDLVAGEVPHASVGVSRTRPVLLWFRRDLRLTDNPALDWAARTGRAVIPVFLLDDDQPGNRPLGGASRWWLHGSLDGLRTALAALGSRLTLRRGAADTVLSQLVHETGATDIVWNRLYDPDAVQRDKRIKTRCAEAGLSVRSFNAALLFEPWTIRTGQGSPYRVFTPFWRRCLQEGFDGATDGPSALPAPAAWPASEALDDWRLRCSIPDWAAGLRAAWQPGEAYARKRLDAFLADRLGSYHEDRDLPGATGTSRLSPHLHFGEIGPRQIAAALEGIPGRGRDAFLREVGWREFSHHLLFHHPEMASASLRSEFDRMPWRNDQGDLRRWQRGLTGYPLVDAGMRELWSTGWMHNRVRMVTASFLTKHLLLDWRLGEGWFWDTLVDADWANNSAGWQWVAGCGLDAAPFVRVFNPVTQSRRFDPSGQYLRGWLPELARLPKNLLHAPWEAPSAALNAAGVRLGTDYPRPMVDHGPARQRALDAFRQRVNVMARH